MIREYSARTILAIAAGRWPQPTSQEPRCLLALRFQEVFTMAAPHDWCCSCLLTFLPIGLTEFCRRLFPRHSPCQKISQRTKSATPNSKRETTAHVHGLLWHNIVTSRRRYVIRQQVPLQITRNIATGTTCALIRKCSLQWQNIKALAVSGDSLE